MSSASYCAWEAFSSATTFKGITSAFFQLCLSMNVDGTDFSNVFSRIRELNDWKAKKLFQLLDKRAAQPEYAGGRLCRNINVLIVGAGPCGLRAAIELALLGCRVVVVEKRDRFSRNNVLHLWQFVISDLKGLGAKFFYPRFCTGSIEHISIRQLQCILLKVALLLGVQVYGGVSFTSLLSPQGEGTGFRALLEPSDHILSTYDFNVLIGAEGRKMTIKGFPRDEMRARLAIGITANFVNNRTSEEERVSEISGLSYVYNQSFFKEMREVTGADLENIVYYKDETHYFVMTAKKQCLLDMGVIKKDSDDAAELLSLSNRDDEALCRFARCAADFATKGQLPCLEYAKNHHHKPDIAMFDFTSLHLAKCSVRLVHRSSRALLLGIVGDSLHEPFWPTGSGCAHGFLGVWDTAWLLRELAAGKDALSAVADRESIFHLLTQVKQDNMHKKHSQYTIDPRTRYVSPRMSVTVEDIEHLINTDGQPASGISRTPQTEESNIFLSAFRFCFFALASYKLSLYNLSSCWRDGRALGALLSKFIPDVVDYVQVISIENVDDRVQHCLSVVSEQLSLPLPRGRWSELADEVIAAFVYNVVTVIRSDERRRGYAMSPKKRVSTVKRPRPKATAQVAPTVKRTADALISCFANGNPEGKEERKRIELASPPPPTPAKSYTRRPLVERLNPELVYRVEKIVTGELLKEEEKERRAEKEKTAKRTHKISREHVEQMEEKLRKADEGVRHAWPGSLTSREEKLMRVSAADARNHAAASFKREDHNPYIKGADSALRHYEERQRMKGLPSSSVQWRSTSDKKAPPAPPPKPSPLAPPTPVVAPPSPMVVSARRVVSMPSVDMAVEKCVMCSEGVYLAERLALDGAVLHRRCFRCSFCSQPLRLGQYGQDKDVEFFHRFSFFCMAHLRLPLQEKLTRIRREQMKRADSLVHPPLSPSKDSDVESEEREKEKPSHSSSCSASASTSTSSSSLFFQPSSPVLIGFRSASQTEVQERSLSPSPSDEECPISEDDELEILGESGEKKEDEGEEVDLDGHSDSDEEEDIDFAEDELEVLEKTVQEFDENAIEASCHDMSTALTVIHRINENRLDALRKQKTTELEQTKEQARERARLKTDSELGLAACQRTPSSEVEVNMPSEGVTLTASLPTLQDSENPGLLSRLFHPTFLKSDAVHVESGKEAGLLSRSWRRLRGSPKGPEGLKSEEAVDRNISEKTRTAVVAPSPRSPLRMTEETSLCLSVDDNTIRRVERRLEKMRRQQADQKARTAQGLQRQLAELEGRIEEVLREGREAEQLLAADPTNRKMLEKWIGLVREKENLEMKEKELQLSVKEMQHDQRHRDLRLQFRQINDEDDDMIQEALLEELMKALHSRNDARTELEFLVRSRKMEHPSTERLLHTHAYNFLNFTSVFF